MACVMLLALYKPMLIPSVYTFHKRSNYLRYDFTARMGEKTNFEKKKVAFY